MSGDAANAKLPLAPRRKWVAILSIAAVGLLAGLGLRWLITPEPAQTGLLQLDLAVRTGTRDAQSGTAPQRERVVPDVLRQKYGPPNRGEFRLTCGQDTAIFVLATGVQIYNQSGWKVLTEEYRGEIWRLKPGLPKEICVERPPNGPWRAFIRYATEMHGPSLLKVQVHEAWMIRSFSNWTGKAWGGGRFGGNQEIVSAAIDE